MYIPNSFAERDLPALWAYIDAHPLATLVTHSDADGLFATHLPMLLDRGAGPSGTLLGHVAKANRHARMGSIEAMVIFTGPDAYITPEWYATKRETGRVVPTWNYAAVHAYGTLFLHDDPAWLRPHLKALTKRHESGRGSAWKVSDAPADYVEQQMKAIVGIEIRIERVEGKWKMSQNRSAADVEGVIRGLGDSPSAQDREVGEIVRERRPTGPGRKAD